MLNKSHGICTHKTFLNERITRKSTLSNPVLRTLNDILWKTKILFKGTLAERNIFSQPLCQITGV
jgi:hypothetical protein